MYPSAPNLAAVSDRNTPTRVPQPKFTPRSNISGGGLDRSVRLGCRRVFAHSCSPESVDHLVTHRFFGIADWRSVGMVLGTTAKSVRYRNYSFYSTLLGTQIVRNCVDLEPKTSVLAVATCNKKWDRSGVNRAWPEAEYASRKHTGTQIETYFARIV